KLAIAEREKTFTPEAVAKWEAEIQQQAAWTPLKFEEMKSAAGATFTQKDDQSVLVGGPLAKDVYSLTPTLDLAKIGGLRIEALPDDSLGAKGPGRAPNGNFVLNELKLSAAPKGQDKAATEYKFAAATADFSQESWPVANAVDGNDGTGWAVS